MHPVHEARYHELEENHCWFKARRAIVVDLLKQWGRGPDSSILEIGCSAGPLLKRLAADGYRDLTGVDISRRAIRLCRENGIPHAYEMDGANPAFDDARFDVVIASDVLEHLADDNRAVANWQRLLKPGGIAIVFVPAYNWLWSLHDVVNQHYRRYTRRSLAEVLRNNGLQPVRLGYWNFTLLAPVVVARCVNPLPQRRAKPAGEGDLHALARPINIAVHRLLQMENWLLKTGFNFPCGISTFAVARNVSSSAAAVANPSGVLRACT